MKSEQFVKSKTSHQFSFKNITKKTLNSNINILNFTILQKKKSNNLEDLFKK